MKDIIWASFIFIWAFLYSLFEIEIEANYGWAKKLPVLQLVKQNKMFPAGLTTWNILMIILVVLSLLNPLIFSKIFNLNFEQKHTILIVISLLSWTFIEDFMWFNYNPYFNKDPHLDEYKYMKFAQFNSQNVKWHSFNSFNFPNLYIFIIGLIIVTFLFYKFNRLNIDPLGEINFYIQFVTYIILIILFSFLSRFYCNFYMNTLNKRNEICDEN